MPRIDEDNEASRAERRAKAFQHMQEQAQVTADESRQHVEARATVEDAQVSGQERHDAATDAASSQQDAGEQWQRFSATQTEAQRSEERQRQADEEEARRDQAQTISAADLLNQLARQSGKINA